MKGLYFPLYFVFYILVLQLEYSFSEKFYVFFNLISYFLRMLYMSTVFT